MIREPDASSSRAHLAKPIDWRGTERYGVRRWIGTGSMGAVYEVFDRERRQPVALKRLRYFSPAALFLFKQEFRTLADVRHPNLVRLYELVATDSREVFFTMELVQGVDFLTHARGEGPADFDRLRNALHQLVEGVQALHAAGKLHRDVKPSNVLVTPEGRVVLLDFGVATELSHTDDKGDREEQPIVGTASYMAPEQAAGATPTPAADWYSVGAILFEALVGNAPFVGPVKDVLRMKATLEARRPSDCVSDVPPELDALCGALLKRAPDNRPTGPEILRWLGVCGSEQTTTARVSLADANGAARAVGRGEHLRALREALAIARSGRCITVRVGGPSGMGKSYLVQDFLVEVTALSEALVLRGRAYERESVPYKAMDSWVDALSRHLLSLSDRHEQIDLPKDVWALARLFPVLRRVPEINQVGERISGDPHRTRQLAFGALRELLASLAKRQPVLVYIDDVHWGDADSAALLLHLVRPPHAPPLLFITTHREEEMAVSPFLLETSANWPQGAEVRELSVGPLDADDAHRLALALLGSEAESAQATAAAVARESQGSPFIVEELVRSYSSTSPPSAPITLEQSVSDRFERLPTGPRRLLEMVAVSGRPLPTSIVGEAGGLGTSTEDAIALLGARRFVRVGLRNGHEVVEMAHERIREAIFARLPADLVRDHHRRLARLLEGAVGADPEAVAFHLLGAGEMERAGPYAEEAAEQAIRKLALNRAVRLFRLALETTPESPNRSHTQVRLALALAWAGRGAESARVYFEVASNAPGLERVELERAAAEQLLASGRIDEGAQALRRVLAAMEVKVPQTTMAALFWLVVYRLWLTIGGLRFVEREPEAVRPEDRVRIEALYAAAMGFAVVDVILGACMQAKLLILSLRSGDRFQVLRASAIEASQLASLGRVPGKRERALFQIAERLASASHNAEWVAFVQVAKGVGHFLRGSWKEAFSLLEANSAKQPYGVNNWHTNANLFGVRALFFLGDIDELTRREALVMADAKERGDLYTAVNFASSSTITVHLAADDPDGARKQLRESMDLWSQTGFFVQHWQAMVFEPDIDLYLGEGVRAYDRLTRDLPALKRSLLMNVQSVRTLTFYSRGRCAVASIDGRPEHRDALVAEARQMARRLERERMSWTAPLAWIVKAVAENAAGNRDAAIAALRSVLESAEEGNMPLHAALARYRLGALLGGDKGKTLAKSALQSIAGRGVRNPSRWAAVHLPGRWPDD
jgi:tetratricopeptide (TPR) repeat protein